MSELGGEEQFGYWEAFFWPLLGVAFIFIPPCDPLFFFKVINVFFIFDLPLFLPDPHSMVSGNAIVVPGAFKESALIKGREKQKQIKDCRKSKCTKWECLSFLFSYAYLWTKGKKTWFLLRRNEQVEKTTAIGDKRKRRQL